MSTDVHKTRPAMCATPQLDFVIWDNYTLKSDHWVWVDSCLLSVRHQNVTTSVLVHTQILSYSTTRVQWMRHLPFDEDYRWFLVLPWKTTAHRGPAQNLIQKSKVGTNIHLTLQMFRFFTSIRVYFIFELLLFDLVDYVSLCWNMCLWTSWLVDKFICQQFKTQCLNEMKEKQKNVLVD